MDKGKKKLKYYLVKKKKFVFVNDLSCLELENLKIKSNVELMNSYNI